jgi:hypothetical protein
MVPSEAHNSRTRLSCRSLLVLIEQWLLLPLLLLV